MTNEPSSSAGAPLALGLHPRGLGTSVLPVSTCHLQDPVADQILQVGIAAETRLDCNLHKLILLFTQTPASWQQMAHMSAGAFLVTRNWVGLGWLCR